MFHENQLPESGQVLSARSPTHPDLSGGNTLGASVGTLFTCRAAQTLGASVGSSFTTGTQRGPLTTGAQVRSLFTADSGYLASGRYRR